MLQSFQGLVNVAKRSGLFAEPLLKLYKDCMSINDGIRFKKSWKYYKIVSI